MLKTIVSHYHRIVKLVVPQAVPVHVAQANSLPLQCIQVLFQDWCKVAGALDHPSHL